MIKQLTQELQSGASEDVSQSSASHDAVQRLLSIGHDETSILQREKLYKELVVRAASRPDMKCKQSNIRFKGTLTLADLKLGLTTILPKQGICAAHVAELGRICEVAFRASKASVAPISSLDDDSIDMNQFHGVVTCLSHYFVLWDTVLREAGEELHGADPKSWCFSFELFQKVLNAMLFSSHADIGVWKFWKEDPLTAFAVASEGNTDRGILFTELTQRCLLHALDERAMSNGPRADCRKRAYQLLQALNNTPSLPNAVPGAASTMSARDIASSGQKAAKIPLLQGAAHFATTYKQSFPAQSPREPDSAYRPAKATNARDIEWRVGPMSARSTRLAMVGASIGR